ncbi:hypothetical protein BDV10DRAFT_100717 [Aspergillus recurvatus]
MLHAILVKISNSCSVLCALDFEACFHMILLQPTRPIACGFIRGAVLQASLLVICQVRCEECTLHTILPRNPQLDKYPPMRQQMLRQVTDSRDKLQSKQGDRLVVSHIFPSLGWTCSTPSRPISLSGLLQEQLRRAQPCGSQGLVGSAHRPMSARLAQFQVGNCFIGGNGHRDCSKTRRLLQVPVAIRTVTQIPVMIRVVLIPSAGQAPTLLQSTDLQCSMFSLSIVSTLDIKETLAWPASAGNPEAYSGHARVAFNSCWPRQ